VILTTGTWLGRYEILGPLGLGEETASRRGTEDSARGIRDRSFARD
jgi:hypothetical protein